MKSFLALAILAVSSIAAAYPALHDKVEFVGTYEGGGGGSITYGLNLEIVNSLNNGTEFVVRATTALPNGRVQSQDDTYKATDLLSQVQVTEILASCTQAGGKIEAVVVPAGTIQACAIPQERGGMVWIGDVTFGIVKQISIDEEENKNTIELKAFQNGI